MLVFSCSITCIMVEYLLKKVIFMENNIFIQNLETIITDRCNLKCEHCARGYFKGLNMSDKVIDTLFGKRHIFAIGALFIGGGEPLLALDTLEKVFTSVVDNNILVDTYSLITNGTIYSEKFFKLLDYFEEYVRRTSRLSYEVKGYFSISADDYHLKEIERVFGKDNKEVWEQMEYLKQSKYFNGFRELGAKLIRTGYANLLDESLTTKYIPKQVFICNNSGTLSIGPSLSINPEGYYVYENSSFEEQEQTTFGNVLDVGLVRSALNRGARVLKPKDWNSEVRKEIMRCPYE